MFFLKDIKAYNIPIPEKKDNISFLRSNQYKLVVVYEDNDTIIIQDFLKRMIESIKIPFNEVLLISLSNENQTLYNFLTLKKESQCVKYLLFVSPDKIGLHTQIPLYKKVIFVGVEIVIADKLELLMVDKSKKLSLWNELKKLFPDN